MKQIKNAASALLTLCLLAALLPAAAVPAHAENSLAEGELFVAGVDIAAEQDGMISTETTGVRSGQAYAYADNDGDPVLVLTGFVYEGAGHVDPSDYYAALRYKGTKPLTILVNGTNSLALSGAGTPPRSYGIHVTNGSASLTVRPGGAEGGSLSVSCCDVKKGIYDMPLFNHGIDCGDLTVENVALTVRAGKVEGYGGCSYGVSCKKLTLRGCTLDAASGDAQRASIGADCSGGLAVADSRLIAAAGLIDTSTGSGGSVALQMTGGSADVSGSSMVTATGGGTPEQGVGESWGIRLSGGLVVRDSAAVTATGGVLNNYFSGTTYGLSCSSDVTVRDSARLTATGGSGSCLNSCGISITGATLTIQDTASVTATGGSRQTGSISRSAGVSLSQQNAVLVVSGGELTALGGNGSGSSYGVYHYIQDAVIRITSGKAVFAGETLAVYCQIANAIEGAGWEDAAGAGEKHGVPVSEEGQGPSFKRLAFPAPEEKLLSLGGALNSTLNDDGFPVGTRISCTVQNAPPDALLIAAWYDHDGRLLGAGTASIDGTGAASAEYSVNSTLVSFGTLMLVDETTFAPLCAPYPLRW